MTAEKIEECKESGRYTLMTELVEKRGKVSGRTAFQAVREGDEAAGEVVDTYITYLASGLASVIDIFHPQIITIGGGISGEGQYLIDRLMPIIRQEQYGGDFIKLTEIRIAELGNDAGIIGAAFLGL